MASIIIPPGLEAADKLALMREDTKFEVSGDRDAEGTALACAAAVRAKPGPPPVPKLILANKCSFNCAYCSCRCGKDKREYIITPRELAQLSVKAAGQNGHGVFITSAIYKNADYTQELLAESARIIREELGYRGYLHAKVMPGADPALIGRTGRYASRLSVNIEVARSLGYERIAKQKNRENILTPMGQISRQIMQARQEGRRFAVSQTTQLMAGSTGEDDRAIMTLARALYDKYRLRRVYYTAFAYTHQARGYEEENLPLIRTPYWRMARLYQADRLLQLYGFTPDDVTPEKSPFLEEDIDPKAAWALRHLDMYPVEINRADYETLIRVPGIGITYANRIIEARRYCTVTHELLKKMRVSLKRSVNFITCGGKFLGGPELASGDIRPCLVTSPNKTSITETLTEDECS